MRRREFLAACGGAFGAALGGVASSLVVDGAAHPGPFRPLGRVALDGATEAVVGDDGEVAYVAVRDGYATVDVSAPDRPSILAERRDRLADRENGPLRNVQDVSVDGDRLLVAGPANPRRNALSGVLVVDVSDPADPVERAFFETDYPIHNCLLVDGLAYLTGNGASEDGNPLVVVDVAGDEPTEVGRWSLLSADDRWADVDRSLWTLHDVWVQGGIAYCAHWDAGTWLVDVRDPADPSAVGSLGTRDPAALAALSTPTMLGVYGWGSDGELTPAELDGSLATVADAGGLLGAWGLTPRTLAELDDLLAVVETEASRLPVEAARGDLGERTIRDGDRTLRLTAASVGTLYFDPGPVAAASELVAAVQDARSLEAAHGALREAGYVTELAIERGDVEVD